MKVEGVERVERVEGVFNQINFYLYRHSDYLTLRKLYEFHLLIGSIFGVDK